MLFGVIEQFVDEIITENELYTSDEAFHYKLALDQHHHTIHAHVGREKEKLYVFVENVDVNIPFHSNSKENKVSIRNAFFTCLIRHCMQKNVLIAIERKLLTSYPWWNTFSIPTLVKCPFNHNDKYLLFDPAL